MFKLIAIRTGRELTDNEIKKTKSSDYELGIRYNYLKSLKAKENYVLFNEYSLNEDGSILTLQPEKQCQEDFYKLKNSLTNVEISAIVGKNGSGKSTLVEILYLAIYNLGVEAKILYNYERELIKDTKKYIHCELYFLLEGDMSYRLELSYDEGMSQYTLYKAKKKSRQYVYKNPSDKSLSEDLKDLFYTISVNYSIYGLNSKDIGDWINHLFHKNDAYQTPLVINPMRTEGNFDINTEKSLTIYRLLSNSVLKYENGIKEVEVAEGIKLKRLNFQLRRDKIEHLEFEKEGYYNSRGHAETNKKREINELILESSFEDLKEIISELVSVFFGNKFIVIENIVCIGEVKLYIIKKLYKIAFTYPKYWRFLKDQNSNDKENQETQKPVKFHSVFKKSKFSEYLQLLKEDTSHITFKLRQAINYLKNNPFEELANQKSQIFEMYNMPFETFSKKILQFDGKIISNLPPSLFEVTIYVSKNDKNSSYELGNLSSGELQLINSVQSTLYHLNNLESYADSKDKDGIHYKNALIIFDEMELYFHPEYQRKIVNHFLKELDQLRFKLIKGIHIIYITHSPFILSDIPHTNQLILSGGKPIKSENTTFGANIHELLIDNFFMNSTIGEFSKEKISEFIKKLNETIKNRNNKKPRLLKKSIKELETLGGQSFIELIGDSLIKDKLLQMYFLATEKSDKEGLKKYYQKKLENLN